LLIAFSMIFNLLGAARTVFAAKITGKVGKELFISSGCPMKVEKKQRKELSKKGAHRFEEDVQTNLITFQLGVYHVF
jgi:hypothetical protein